MRRIKFVVPIVALLAIFAAACGSADTIQMGNAVRSGVVPDKGKVFARNSLVVITPADASPKVASLSDLGKPGLKLVLANKDVPVGNYARQMLTSMEKDASYGAGW